MVLTWLFVALCDRDAYLNCLHPRLGTSAVLEPKSKGTPLVTLFRGMASVSEEARASNLGARLPSRSNFRCLPTRCQGSFGACQKLLVATTMFIATDCSWTPDQKHIT